MDLELFLYLWALSASTLVAAALSWYTWRWRSMPGAALFALVMAAASFWALANTLEMAAPSLAGKLFWANVQYLSLSTIPVLWLIMTLQITGYEHRLSPRQVSLLWVIPVITLGLVWTNPLHGLIRRDVFLDNTGPFPVIGRTYGSWFWVHLLYSYLLVLASVLRLIKTLVTSIPPLRWQTLILLAGVLLPLGWNALYITGISPFQQLDITPTVLSLSGVIIAWGIFHFRLFDLLPAAHDALLMSIRDGVIILDAKRKVVAINPAAQDQLNWKSSEVVGRPSEQVFSPWPELVQLLVGERTAQTEFALFTKVTPSFYDLSLSPLLDPYGRSIGQLVILHDITERKLVEEGLRSLSLTDSLTGLPNRRKFFESMRLEIERARRYQIPLSVVMIDVDGLKHINDTFGHLAGDQALQYISLCMGQLRQPDIAARLGGDEFALLLPFTSPEGAEQVIGRLLNLVQKYELEDGTTLSISLGIAVLQAEDDERGETLLKRADQAMYRVKQSRRGRKDLDGEQLI